MEKREKDNKKNHRWIFFLFPLYRELNNDREFSFLVNFVNKEDNRVYLGNRYFISSLLSPNKQVVNLLIKFHTKVFLRFRITSSYGISY